MSIQFNPDQSSTHCLELPSREFVYSSFLHSSLTQNADKSSIGCCGAILDCLMELWNALIAFFTFSSGENESQAASLETLLNKADGNLNPNITFKEQKTLVDQAIKLIRDGAPVTEEMFWQMIKRYPQDHWSEIFSIACEKMQPTKDMLNEGFKKVINDLEELQNICLTADLKEKSGELGSFLLEKGVAPMEIMHQSPEVIQKMIVFSDWIEDCFKNFFSKFDQKNKNIALTLAVKDQMAIVDTGMPMSFHAASTLIGLGADSNTLIEIKGELHRAITWIDKYKQREEV